MRFTILLFLLPAISYSQKTFTLAELIRMNGLSEKDLTKQITDKNFFIENRFHDTVSKILFLSFADSEKQTISKRWDEEANSLNYHTSLELNFAAYRKELIRSGFQLTDQINGENEAITELYEKNVQVISLYYSPMQSDGSPPVYEVNVSNGRGGAISTHGL